MWKQRSRPTLGDTTYILRANRQNIFKLLKEVKEKFGLTNITANDSITLLARYGTVEQRLEDHCRHQTMDEAQE